MYHKLLIDDYPIQVLPKLAESIGLNEAIVLQQIHYWLNKSDKYIDGRKWVYNTYEGWQKQFSFWSLSTVKRVLNNLRKQGLLLTGNYNKAGFDKTVWYTIDYDLLNRMNQRLGQNDLTSGSNWTDGAGQNDLTNTIDYTETTTETTKDIPSSSVEQDRIPFKEIVDYLNLKASKDFKSTSADTKKLIKARWNEGYKLDDFKQVVDNKCFGWANDSEMSKYLRPKTLFGTKFESYLNENQIEKENIGYTRTNNDYAGTPFG